MFSLKDKWALVTGASGGIGKPDDVGYTAVFLASDEALYINGQIILVNGGRIR